MEACPMTYTHATAHVGPKGGVEYRLWTDSGSFYVVGRYKALPHMTPEAREHADKLEADRKASKASASASDQSWREIMRGG